MHAEYTSGSMRTTCLMQAFKCEYSLQARAVHVHKGGLCLNDVHRKEFVELHDALLSLQTPGCSACASSAGAVQCNPLPPAAAAAAHWGLHFLLASFLLLLRLPWGTCGAQGSLTGLLG